MSYQLKKFKSEKILLKLPKMVKNDHMWFYTDETKKDTKKS